MPLSRVGAEDTIVACCSGALPCGVAVVRLSGNKSRSIAEKLFKPKVGTLPWRRGMYYGSIQDASGEHIDDGLLLWFEEPNSFTGEDVVELQLHGAEPLVLGVLSSAVQLGARLAQPGEFSWRAFVNGKTSGRQLEQLAGIYQARDVSGANGKNILGGRVDAVARDFEGARAQWIAVRASLETAVDFSEEEESVLDLVKKEIEKTISSIEALRRRFALIPQFSHGRKIGIFGLPNAGKSSLFNALLAQKRSLVHDRPGTTRDVVEEEVWIAGRVWKLGDTAGLRETTDVTEKMGIVQGSDYLETCSAVIWVVDGSAPNATTSVAEVIGQKPCVLVWNKADQPKVVPPPGWIGVSAHAGAGLGTLMDALAKVTRGLATEGLGLLTVRENVVLEKIAEALSALQLLAREEAPPELLAEEALLIDKLFAQLISEITPEEVYDMVFSRFCIGK